MGSLYNVEDKSSELSHLYVQLDWKETVEASERMVLVLQGRLESTRSQLYDQDKLVGQLRSDLQVAAEELHYWKEQRTQDIEKIEQVCT